MEGIIDVHFGNLKTLGFYGLVARHRYIIVKKSDGTLIDRGDA